MREYVRAFPREFEPQERVDGVWREKVRRRNVFVFRPWKNAYVRGEDRWSCVTAVQVLMVNIGSHDFDKQNFDDATAAFSHLVYQSVGFSALMLPNPTLSDSFQTLRSRTSFLQRRRSRLRPVVQQISPLFTAKYPMARIANEADALRMKGRRYGSLEPEDFSDDDDLLHEERFHHSNKNDVQASTKHSRRWSVMEKLERHYGENSEGGKFRNISSKCVFATLMLTAFIVCGWYFTRTILFNIQLNPELYDFIVVGGGPAGTVVTRRLLDEGAYVLMLEAGDYTQFTVVDNKHGPNTARDFSSSPGASISEYDIPLLWSSVAQATQAHWGHFNALNVNPFKGLGGSAMEGAMLNVWAVSADVLSWGVSGWSWENLLDAYKHLELYSKESGKSPQGEKNQEMRGTEGFLPTSETGCLDALGTSFVAAATEMGEDYIGGFNAQMPRVGVGCYETNIADGVRVSPPSYLLKSYLESASKAPRLTLRTKATVRKVILSKEATSSLSIGIISRRTDKKKFTDTHTTSPTYRAIGVEYELDGTIHYAYLKNGPSRNSRNNAMARNFESLRCVVLAAGAVRTPALLLNSGIGPVEELRAAGLEAKVDSDRVGRGLRDHVAVGMVYEASEYVSSDAGSAYSLPQQWSRYLKAIQKAQEVSAASPSSPSSSNSGGVASTSSRTSEVDSEGGTSSGESGKAKTARGTSSFGSGDTVVPKAAMSAKDFGILGRNGISAGAFLVSPYARNRSVGDIQLTLYPSVTEPHFLALMDKKQKDARAAGSSSSTSSQTSGGADASVSDAQGESEPRYRGGRNQILITVSLLYPDAEFQVVLNSTFPLLGNPSVLPAGDAQTRLGRSSLSGGNKRVPARTRESESSEKNVASGDADKAGEETQDGESVHRAVDNILPRALSELDVKRLTWAAGRVRELMAAMLQRGEVVWELSPGIQILSDLPGVGGNSSHTGDSSATLSAWVRENAFFQGNWVGSAGMGATKAAGPAPAPSSSGSAGSRTSGGKGGVSADAPAGRGPDPVPVVALDTDDDYDDYDDIGKGGDSDTPSSVLDEELRVRGVVALRVVDASAIPAPISGNIQATVQAVAHRAADFILKNANSND